MRPGLDRGGSDVERKIAEQPYLAGTRVLAQALPLHVKRVLLALDMSDFRRQLTARRFERRRITIAQRHRPIPEGCPAVRHAERLEQRVVAQPGAGDREELRTDRCVRIGHLRGIEEGGVAGKIRPHPVRRAICTDGSDGQYLPYGEPPLGQPVDEGAAAATERCIERGHWQQHPGTAPIEYRKSRAHHGLPPGALPPAIRRWRDA